MGRRLGQALIADRGQGRTDISEQRPFDITGEGDDGSARIPQRRIGNSCPDQQGWGGEEKYGRPTGDRLSFPLVRQGDIPREPTRSTGARPAAPVRAGR